MFRVISFFKKNARNVISTTQEAFLFSPTMPAANSPFLLLHRLSFSHMHSTANAEGRPLLKAAHSVTGSQLAFYTVLSKGSAKVRKLRSICSQEHDALQSVQQQQPQLLAHTHTPCLDGASG